MPVGFEPATFRPLGLGQRPLRSGSSRGICWQLRAVPPRPERAQGALGPSSSSGSKPLQSRDAPAHKECGAARERRSPHHAGPACVSALRVGAQMAACRSLRTRSGARSCEKALPCAAVGPARRGLHATGLELAASVKDRFAMGPFARRFSLQSRFIKVDKLPKGQRPGTADVAAAARLESAATPASQTLDQPSSRGYGGHPTAACAPARACWHHLELDA